MTVFHPAPDAPPGRARLAPPPRPAPLRRRQIAAAVSVAVHVGAILLLIFAIPRPDVPLSADESVELMFEDATSSTASTSVVTGTDQPPLAAPPPAPTPPAPNPEPTPPEAKPSPVPVEPPTPAQVSPPQTEPPPVEPPEPVPVPLPIPVPPEQPRPEPPVPEAATRSVPVVRLEAPAGPEPEPLVPDFQPPAAPPPLPRPPPVPRPPAAVPPAPPRVVERPRYAPGFSPPIDLSYSQTPTRPQTSPGTRGLDLSPGAPKAGPNKQEAFYDARARAIGAEWANGLSVWWLAHRYYPRQAAENGDDGTVKVELTINRSGRVEHVEVRGRSGSPFLDMAALSVWRGAQLSPFPAENPKERETIEITINYLLIR